MTYAKHTEVPVARTRAEIEELVSKHGATRFGSGWGDGAINIMFAMRDRSVRFFLPLPQPTEKRFLYDGNGKRRNQESLARAHEQAMRSRWRSLLLVIKAKLEAVESGVTTFEEEFLAHIILPNGDTVGEWALPRLKEAFAAGSDLPPLLGAGGGAT